MSITAAQRFTRSHPCRICGGYDQAPRGHGVRCCGFLSEDTAWCRCSREEHAGGLSLDARTCPPTYAHRLNGTCKCGVTHDRTVSPVSVEGLEWTRQRRRPNTPEPVGTLDRYYVYTDQYSVPRHRTVRFRDPKSFRQQRYVIGEWRWGLGDIETVLYGLPRLFGLRTDEPVFLAEGERDCESLWDVWLVATTQPNGSWKQHYNQWLAGRPVVIVEDNDDAGRMRTRRLQRQLNNVAASVRIISFPDLPEGGDVSDWLAGGGTAGELLEPVAAPYMETRQA